MSLKELFLEVHMALKELPFEVDRATQLRWLSWAGSELAKLVRLRSLERFRMPIVVYISSAYSTDDCGAAANNGNGGNPGEGTFYANIIDTANNNAMVGRCVYASTDSTTCTEGIGSGTGEQNVFCYTAQYGTTQC
ncbi:hypothetical protein PRZ48_012659 [Zasmidium cellare]|uniref:Uncharacterized protein n=1 Tax=Zasmidium cellare TaxID=395010 RepID=A0ABR0E5H5_ZASCE|nr:hypothetical protein PRZ48_012659 [Zasmidium cellare]